MRERETERGRERATETERETETETSNSEQDAAVGADTLSFVFLVGRYMVIFFLY
jgi:hypothetical protein